MRDKRRPLTDDARSRDTRAFDQRPEVQTELTAAERWFIRTVSDSYAEKIELCLSLRPVIIQSSLVARRGRLVTLAANLYRYCLLCLELMVAGLRHSPVQNDAVIFFDHTAGSHPKRVKYLKYMLGEKRFKGIARQDKVCSLPDVRAAIHILPRLLVIVLAAALQRQSGLTSHYVWIVRACLLCLSHAAECPDPSLYLFAPYRVESPFIAGFLKERGVCVNLVTYTTPLTFYNRVLVGDSLKAGMAYQCDEFKHYQHLGECPTCELWAPETIYLMAERYCGMRVDEHPDIIGVYTQGFWLRAKLGLLNPDVVQNSIQREKELIEVMLSWIKLQPDVKLVIFPHPLERRHLRQGGDHQFGEILQNPQVEVDLEEHSDSILQFDRVGLGVSTLSSIGFDRIHMGFRTLFYTLPWIPGLEIPDRNIQSKFNQVFISEREAFIKAVEHTREMTHREFMYSYFGQEFFQRTPVD